MDILIQKHGFSDSGARDFLKVYDATITHAKLSESDKASVEPVDTVQAEQQDTSSMTPRAQASPTPTAVPHAVSTLLPLKHGMRQEIITLDEGDVVLTFPANLTSESFADLKDHLDLFIKKMQRRAGVSAVRSLPASISCMMSRT